MLKYFDSSRVLVSACIGLNTAVVVADLAHGDFRAGALQSIALLLLTAWWAWVPKADALLEARVGEAVAQRRMAEIGLAVVEEQRRAGNVRVNIVGEASARVN
jgi:hypothetical protein